MARFQAVENLVREFVNKLKVDEHTALSKLLGHAAAGLAAEQKKLADAEAAQAAEAVKAQEKVDAAADAETTVAADEQKEQVDATADAAAVAAADEAAAKASE